MSSRLKWLFLRAMICWSSSNGRGWASSPAVVAGTRRSLGIASSVWCFLQSWAVLLTNCADMASQFRLSTLPAMIFSSSFADQVAVGGGNFGRGRDSSLLVASTLKPGLATTSKDFSVKFARISSYVSADICIFDVLIRNLRCCSG